MNRIRKIGAMLALRGCAHNDGYTMGFNQAARDGSMGDLFRFMSTTWEL